MVVALPPTTPWGHSAPAVQADSAAPRLPLLLVDPPAPDTPLTNAKPTSVAPVVPSAQLLGQHQAIEIEHNGQRYRLQSTRSGKLILTK